MDARCYHSLPTGTVSYFLFFKYKICILNYRTYLFLEIEKMRVKPTPTRLQHMDVSHNNFSSLPDWLGGCHEMRVLFATHNKLTSLPEHLFCSELSSLHTLRLGYNKLHSLPSVPRLRIPLQELFLQNNCLHSLPPNFFAACDQLKVLNLSNNRLTQLPNIIEPLEMEKLYLTANCLNDNVMETLRSFYRLRILHIAYNCLTSLPEHCIASWSQLEELVLSGNNIQHLPNNLAGLPHIRILRVHSNRLQSTPTFAYSSTLKVLDLAHNELDVINLVSLVPKQLQFLDISCNVKLRVDPKQFHMYRSQRPMSLVDVSGQNRITLPSQPWPHYDGGEGSLEPPWKVGFTETSGNKKYLCVAQLRQPAFCNIEGLFGLFDGGSDSEIPNILAKSIPRILLEERAVKETANEYMKYTILSAHRELKEKGQRNGACVTLCHISRVKSQPELGFAPTPRKYVLRIASVGEASAVLVRPSGSIRLTPNISNQRIGNAERFPNVVPNPEIAQVILQENDEFLIMANKKLWEVIDLASAIEETRSEKNVILAAKRLQDLAQSYGAEENLSVMIIRFNGPGSDVDQLMRELRHTIKKSKAMNNSPPPAVCQTGCCCEYQNNCCHTINQPPLKLHGSDRSSPSGQSDQTNETVTIRSAQTKIIDKQLNNSHNNLNQFLSTNKIQVRAPQPPLIIQESAIRKMSERRSCRGVAKAIRARIEEQRENEREDTDSAVSEEQFKCWEYMLEQNTQLLFDKELNTLSKGFTKNPSANLRNLRNLSNSSPQLAIPPPPPPPLLTRHYGSARSYNPTNFRPEMRFGSGRSQLNGGPHAAYFGSLQRLMPYNLEYDFAVIQERSAQDSLDHEGRMQQYWGVATTEL